MGLVMTSDLVAAVAGHSAHRTQGHPLAQVATEHAGSLLHIEAPAAGQTFTALIDLDGDLVPMDPGQGVETTGGVAVLHVEPA